MKKRSPATGRPAAKAPRPAARAARGTNRVVAELSHCWSCPDGANTEKGLNLAGQQAVHHVLDELVAVLFPGCHGRQPARSGGLTARMQRRLDRAAAQLRDQARRAFQYACASFPCRGCHTCRGQTDEAVRNVVAALPEVQRVLQSDIRAAFEGDPAARSTMEVVMSYPGVYAVIVHRVAHLLHAQGVPLIPRIMSERAHSLTGIDIHPGARIGPGFFIDHGTGVVIGETCEIGAGVKLYQGVTLGALSFEKDASGRLVKGVKRHPNVGDHVVIYAGATILGGTTTIGDHSVVGGNVWLTHSVPPHSRVYNQQPQPMVRQANGTWRRADGVWNDYGEGI